MMLVGALLLLGAWVAWFGLARVPVYETSEKARLEVLRSVFPVDTPVAGRVVDVRITLDQVVAEGDVLVRLDAAAEQLQLDQTRARVAGIEPQLAALRNQVESDRRALLAFDGQLASQLAETQSRVDEAAIVTQSAKVEAERSDRLFADGLASAGDHARSHAESDRFIAAETTARAQLERQRREAATGAEDRRSHILAFDREAAALAAQLSSLEATIPALEHAVELRTIRAPASGHIGETASIRVGQVLAEASHLATVVASGDMRVIASMAPASFGRVSPGQSARVRLDAFPWTEYGALTATVTDVAKELHEGQVRIELTVDASSAHRIPLQHGLPGRVDVTVDQASPARLILRAAGQLGT
jgi:membrane fusion protein (multidrug efflux system)